MKLNLFDKICAVLAFVIGIILLLLGGLGLFKGCHADFTLPPIWGAFPLLVGWGIIKPILISWKKPTEQPPQPLMPHYPGLSPQGKGFEGVSGPNSAT